MTIQQREPQRVRTTDPSAVGHRGGSVLVVTAAQRLADHVAAATGFIPGAWRVLVAEDGTVAGRILATEQIRAAVVTLEPAQGGLAFLDWLRRRHPHITRIAAFPKTTSDHAIKAVNVAHVYVAPDIPQRDLGHLIGRTVGLQSSLGAEKLIACAGSLQRIPSIPRVYAELRAVISDPDYDLAQVAKVIARDPGLSVKVLQIVNSAFYGLRQRVSDVSHAVSLLGSGTVTSLVLGITLHDQFNVMGRARQILEDEWQRALTIAEAARRIASSETREREVVEAAYLAGLLHNVGRLVLATNLSDRFTAITWPKNRREAIVIERSAFGAGHPELGAFLLGSWGLDDALVEAIAFYADPSKSLGTKFSPLTALHVAVGFSDDGADFIDQHYLGSLGLTSDPTHTH